MENLYQKINDVMLEVVSVVKDAEIQISKDRAYKAVSHDAVTRALHIPIAKAGIVLKVSQESCTISDFEQIKVWNSQETKSKVYRADISVKLTLINADNPEEREEAFFSAYAFDSGDKATGKALSMAVKNGLLKMFMLESLDKEESREEDGAEYNQRTKPINQAPATPNKTPQAPAQGVAKNEPKPAQAAPGYKGEISDAQAKRFWAMTKQLKWSIEDSVTHLKQMAGVDMPIKLSREQYKLITDNLQKEIDDADSAAFSRL